MSLSSKVIDLIRLASFNSLVHEHLVGDVTSHKNKFSGLTNLQCVQVVCVLIEERERCAILSDNAIDCVVDVSLMEQKVSCKVEPVLASYACDKSGSFYSCRLD
jgi:hypothetical protein